MAFVLSSFLGGMAKGATDYIDEQQKLNADSMSLSVKSMVKDYADYQKTTKEQKDMMKQTVRELSGISFSDGILSDEQLIAMAAKPEQAKIILEKIKNDPEVTGRISKNFVKALEGTPTGVKPEDYINSLFKTAKATDEQVQAAFGGNQTGGIMDKIINKNSIVKAQKEAAQYGISLEDLLGAKSGAAKAVTAAAQIDLSVFSKPKQFADLMDRAKVNVQQAQNPDPTTGVVDENNLKTAVKNLASLVATEAMSKPPESKDVEKELVNLIDATSDPKEKQTLEARLVKVQALKAGAKNKPEAEVQTELLNKIQDPNTSPEDRKRLSAQLAQRISSLHPRMDKPETIPASTLISGASRAIASAVTSIVPKGAFKITTAIDGSVTTELTDMTKSEDYRTALIAGKQGLIYAYTDKKTGLPLSEAHRIALTAQYISFDANGKPVIPEESTASPRPAPPAAAPGARAGGATPRAAAAPTVDAAFVAAERAKAKAAIANGKDPDAVKALFKSNTNQDY
jgi:hypothetical protein